MGQVRCNEPDRQEAVTTCHANGARLLSAGYGGGMYNNSMYGGGPSYGMPGPGLGKGCSIIGNVLVLITTRQLLC